MPLIQKIKRINPLDVSKRATIGLAFPLNVVNMTSGTETTKDQIKTNFLNLLLTVPGERINQPNYGIGLKNLLFENNIDEDSLLENINTKVEYYMPEIIVNNSNIKRDIDMYKINIRLDYTIKLDNVEDSIQINYS